MTKKGGRPSKYEELNVTDKLDAVRGWAKIGGLQQVADGLDVSIGTVRNWKGRYEEFREAVKLGKKDANGEINATLFECATGYVREVTEPMKMKKSVTGADGKRTAVDTVELVTYKKYFPPSPQVLIFMARQRMPEIYTKEPVAEDEDGTKITVVSAVPRSDLE